MIVIHRGHAKRSAIAALLIVLSGCGSDANSDGPSTGNVGDASGDSHADARDAGQSLPDSHTGTGDATSDATGSDVDADRGDADEASEASADSAGAIDATDASEAGDASADAQNGTDGGEAGDEHPTDELLTVAKLAAATGQGTVSSTPLGLTCDGACTSIGASFPHGTAVHLEAKPSPGSFFQGWSGACSGTSRFCDLDLDAPQSATAEFTLTTHNLAFATSETYTGKFGGLDGADANCSRLASAAGLTGTWVAYLSTPDVDAKSRLGTARGFQRLDGKPISDTVADLADTHRLWNSVGFDENGTMFTSYEVTWTGSTVNDVVDAYTCQGWTSEDAGDYGRFGEANAGPLDWMQSNPQSCNNTGRIYCFQTDKTTAIDPPVPTAGKRIYITKAHFLPGGGIGAANDMCDAEKPNGVTTVKALLATKETPASSLVDAATKYVRPDGVLVGTGADLVAVSKSNGNLNSAAWQNGDGTYEVESYSYFCWTGSSALDQTGTVDTTCDDWTTAADTPTGTGGINQRPWDSWWNQYTGPCSTTTYHLYCVEQ